MHIKTPATLGFLALPRQQHIMKLAKKKGYIIINPFVDIEVNVGGCKPPNNPKDESRVYLPEEIERLFHQLRVRLEQNPAETDSYVVFLLFKLGLRIGEAVALKWNLLYHLQMGGY